MAPVDPSLAAEHLVLDDLVPASERAFYVYEFAGASLVISLAAPPVGDGLVVANVARAARALAEGGSRLVLAVGGRSPGLVAALPSVPVELDAPVSAADQDPGAGLDESWLADLWLALTDQREVVVHCAPGDEPVVGARLAAALGARKLVVTDHAGGWGRPPRSFADVVTHADAFGAQLADRQGGAVVAALQTALAGGVPNVNLCRPADVDRELFTFDGAGTLFTSGGYVELGPLRVDDLPAVERLVAQGVADGLLRPRTRTEVARLAVGGLGARVVGSGHLAGIVGLDQHTYAGHGLGEVSCLYTVSRFSGAGAGALLVDALVERAAAAGLAGVFAVTVSEAAAAFFARKGFDEVGHDAIPAAKWAGYDPERRSVARAFLRSTAVDLEQGTLGF